MKSIGILIIFLHTILFCVGGQGKVGDWTLVWSDEFESTEKVLPDSTKWSYDVGGHGWGNNEKQYYKANSINNSYVENGYLHVVAIKENFGNAGYTSAKLMTYGKELFQYGRIEVSAKLPKGTGTWPAVWMLPQTIQIKEEPWPLCGEIDIMEHVGRDPGVVHVTLHSELYNHLKGTQLTHFEKQDDVFNTFHEYAIEWKEDCIRFYIDGNLFYESHKGEDGRVSGNEGWPFNKPYYLILNLAIGGDWGGEVDDSIFPCEMQVDYVRVYR